MSILCGSVGEKGTHLPVGIYFRERKREREIESEREKERVIGRCIERERKRERASSSINGVS